MENQLISFETAKLAYQLKFDIRGAAAYKENGINSIRTNSYHYTKQAYPINIVSQALLQKWLRETHSIEVPVIYFDKGYLFAVSKRPITGNHYSIEKYYETYESALETALKNALQLIENSLR